MLQRLLVDNTPALNAKDIAHFLNEPNINRLRAHLHGLNSAQLRQFTKQDQASLMNVVLRVALDIRALILIVTKDKNTQNIEMYQNTLQLIDEALVWLMEAHRLNNTSVRERLKSIKSDMQSIMDALKKLVECSAKQKFPAILNPWMLELAKCAFSLYWNKAHYVMPTGAMVPIKRGGHYPTVDAEDQAVYTLIGITKLDILINFYQISENLKAHVHASCFNMHDAANYKENIKCEYKTLQEIIADYSSRATRVKRGLFAGQLPADLRELNDLINQINARTLDMEKGLRKIMSVAKDNRTIHTAAKKLLSTLSDSKKYAELSSTEILVCKLYSARPTTSVEDIMRTMALSDAVVGLHSLKKHGTWAMQLLNKDIIKKIAVESVCLSLNGM